MKMLESLPAACACVKTIHLPSRDQMGLKLLNCLAVLLVMCVIFLVGTPIVSISYVDESFGFTAEANFSPSGDQAGPSSDTSFVLVRFTTWALAGADGKMRHCAVPS